METYNNYLEALKDWAKEAHKVMDRFDEGDVEDSYSHATEGILDNKEEL